MAGGKTDKDKKKAADKWATKKKPAMKDILAKKSGGGKAKKKWSKTKSKEKLNNAVYWTKSIWDKLSKDVVAKEAYLTPSIISEKCKVNVSLARQAIKGLLEEQKIAPNSEYHSKYTCFVKTANFVAPVSEKKEGGETKTAKGGKK